MLKRLHCQPRSGATSSGDDCVLDRVAFGLESRILSEDELRLAKAHVKPRYLRCPLGIVMVALITPGRPTIAMMIGVVIFGFDQMVVAQE